MVDKRDWSASDFAALSARGLAVNLEASARVAASGDFGGIVKGQALGVIAPRAAEEVQAVLRFASENGLRLTGRNGGRSSGGQSVPRRGASLELSRLDAIDAPDTENRTIRCQAGARFRSIVASTLPHGLLPCVMPLNLDLSVGGTLSVGGFGSNSHKLGFSACNVAAIEAVSGDGQMLSSAADAALMDATLGGLGRASIMTALTLKLRPAPPMVRTFFLLYDDIEAWLHDLQTHGQRFDHFDGFCSASVQGMKTGPQGRRPFAKWLYGLHASIEYADAAPNAETALTGMQHRWLVHQEDNAQAAFVARADPRFEMMALTGAATQPHPWLECVLPWRALPELLPKVLEMLPLALGDGHRLAPLAELQPPRSIATPIDRRNAMFAVLPMGVPAALLPGILQAVRAVSEALIQAGGKRYLSGFVELDEDGWKRHYGDTYEAWRQEQSRLDPAGVLGGCL